MGDTAPAEILFQLLRYERAIPEDHTSRDGRLPRVQPVTERRVGAAVDASDPGSSSTGQTLVASTTAETPLVATYESQTTKSTAMRTLAFFARLEGNEASVELTRVW